MLGLLFIAEPGVLPSILGAFLRMRTGVFRIMAVLILCTGVSLTGVLGGPTFVVLGDGLAADMSGLELTKRLPQRSFGAQLAGHIGRMFPQVEFQPPGPATDPFGGFVSNVNPQPAEKPVP